MGAIRIMDNNQKLILISISGVVGAGLFIYLVKQLINSFSQSLPQARATQRVRPPQVPQTQTQDQPAPPQQGQQQQGPPQQGQQQQGLPQQGQQQQGLPQQGQQQQGLPQPLVQQQPSKFVLIVKGQIGNNRMFASLFKMENGSPLVQNQIGDQADITDIEFAKWGMSSRYRNLSSVDYATRLRNLTRT